MPAGSGVNEALTTGEGMSSDAFHTWGNLVALHIAGIGLALGPVAEPIRGVFAGKQARSKAYRGVPTARDSAADRVPPSENGCWTRQDNKGVGHHYMALWGVNCRYHSQCALRWMS